MTDQDHRLRAASFLLLRCADEVLLQRRAPKIFMGGHWACGAAGHIERGESASIAICREAQEELGVVVTPEELTPLCAMQATDGPDSEWAYFWYECRTWQGDPHIAEPHKTTDLRWFPLRHLPTPMVPHERAVIEAIGAGHVPPVMYFGY